MEMSSIPLEREFHHPPEYETSSRPDESDSKQSTRNILIAVVGLTGVGKSYFIRDVSGLSTVVVGDSLVSCTSEVIEYAFEYAGITITLIDTPGFNNTKLSDMEVLTKIASWIQKRYSNHQLLSGIIYLHRITDVRMEGPSLKILQVFEKLVGEDCLDNVLLTTTGWSEIAKEEGEARETKLKLTPEYWGNMIKSGATVARYMGCCESGLKLIDKLIGNTPKALTIQEELAVPGTKLIDRAAIFINKLLEIQAELSKDLEETKEAHKRAMEQQKDMFKMVLEVEQQKMQEQLDKIAKDCKESLARHNADLIRQEEAERRVKEDAERAKLMAMVETERVARQELERKEAERRAREDAERAKWMAMVETERVARQELERKEAEKGAREDAERKAKEEAGGDKLCHASQNNNTVLVRQLLESGIGVNWGNKDGLTALFVASRGGHEVIVRLLLAKGADVNVNSKYAGTALHGASPKGHEAIVRLLLANGADIHAKDDYARTALYLASCNGHEAIVRLLLAKGAEVHAKNKYGNTALHGASCNGNEVIVRLLLERGANVDEDSVDGTALHYALYNNKQSIVQLLLKNGANVHTRKVAYNETTLHSACHGECDEAIIWFLLGKGVDVHAKSSSNMTLLMFASKAGYAAIVQLLLEKGVDVNVQGFWGTTALIMASAQGHLVVVQLLLEKGADVKLKDRDGKTALSFALENRHLAVVQLLREAGAT